MKIKYIFEISKNGETVPVLCLPEGNQSLHSMIDPIREARRLTSNLNDDDLAVFMGLGGGFAPQAALELPNTRVLVIDFDKESIEQLLKEKDYKKLFTSSRFTLLADPLHDELEKFLFENFKPALFNSLKIIPLRTRTEKDKEKFEAAADIIQKTIKIISGDYSVQAYFGMKWFSNIIRNIKNADSLCLKQTKLPVKQIEEAAIAAAGPSLDSQIKNLSLLKSKNVYIISTDTALGALLHNGVKPDAVVSIDCQHISFYHFLGCDIKKIPLVLDIASPSMLTRFSDYPVFFSSGHPLAKYVSNNWRPLPALDTSGGNVTYACLSLAETLGAKRITLFGADFSYIGCRSYAKGTYLNPYFDKKQNRLSPLESQMSSFLYRTPFLPLEDQNQTYRETASLRFYRKKLEEKISAMKAEVICAQGFGAPVCKITNAKCGINDEEWITGSGEPGIRSGIEFLKLYKNDILELPVLKDGEEYFNLLDDKQKMVFTTFLPYMAAVKKRNPELKQKDLIETVKQNCAAEIDRVLC